MAENPKVHSKGATFHGVPHAPGAVTTPGGMAPESSGAKPVTRSSTTREHASTHYHPNEHGRMHEGKHAEHPTHGKKENG